jgi:hypothetical protein
VRYMTHNDANFGYTVGVGQGSAAYPHKGIPYKVLIGADGKIIKMGNVAVTNGDVEDALKKAKKLKPEELEPRAAKALEAAEKLIADKQLARAEALLQKTATKFAATESGKKAKARVAELAAAELKAEYDAQKELVKLVGVEKPAEKVDPKAADKLVKALEKKSAEWKETAPKAAELATQWVTVLRNPWK